MQKGKRGSFGESGIANERMQEKEGETEVENKKSGK